MAAPASVAQAVAAISLDDKTAAAAAAAPTEAASSSSSSGKNEEKKKTDGGDEAESSDDEDEADEKGAAGGAAAGDKKKKKKKKKKKAGAAAAVAPNACGVHLFCQGGRNPVANAPSLINGNKSVKHRQQTSPVSVPVADMFKDKIFPEGQIMKQPQEFNVFRQGSEEKRAAERQYTEILNEIREAAEVHRQVRSDFMRWVRPGLSMIEIAQYIESGTRAGLKAVPGDLKRGWAFPTGLSLNNVAAHWAPNSKDTTVLKQGDVMKVDYGTHINGRIVDCAFTVAFDPKYDPLINAVKEATNAGIAAAGIDVRLCDIGESIQEVMESHEIELGGVTLPIKSIRNLNGHSIGLYNIHAGKSVPIVKNTDTQKMEEGEFYAIETFGSTGRGHVVEDGECSHYMKVYDNHGQFKPLRTKAAKDVLRHIDSHHGTLAFARRWLDDDGCKNHLGGLNELIKEDIVRAYPPLVDIKGSYTAQFEHTIFMRPTCKEVISRGDDY